MGILIFFKKKLAWKGADEIDVLCMTSPEKDRKDKNLKKKRQSRKRFKSSDDTALWIRGGPEEEEEGD